MGFFKDLRDDISQAVNELLPDDDFFGIEEEDTEEESFLHLEEKEKTENEDVQEDILAALAHLGEDTASEDNVETIEPDNMSVEILESQEESNTEEESQEERQEEPSNGEVEEEFVQKAFSEVDISAEDGMEDAFSEEESSNIVDDVVIDNLESDESEFVLDEIGIDEQGISEEELLKEEAESGLSEDEQSEEEIPEEEPSVVSEEISFENESEWESFGEMQNLEIGEIAEANLDNEESKEEEELLVTNVDTLYTEEEKEEESLENELENVSVTEELETFVEQQEDEESMSRGEKAEVSEPIIEENIIEKEENIMENNLENVQATDQVTVITKGTVINGSISSDGGLEVNGTITGDVECLGKLTINGNVSGHLKAAEVVVSTPRLDGGIDSEGDVKIGVGTIVIGDVTAKAATISGAVKGEIDVQGPVVVDSTAIVKGNITAKSVQINNGAVVDGYCKLSYAEVDIDNFFDGE